MTENLPAVRTDATVATQDTDSWTNVMSPLLRLAETVHDTEFVPRGLRGNMPATAAAMLYGREVGLPPMTALNMMSVIDGKPGLSAEGMRALILAAGHDIDIPESTGASCTMRGRRRGGEKWTAVVWTLDMARAAGLAGNPRKENWVKYPRAMLQARATTELARLLFPDVIHGFRSLEELADMGDGDDTAGNMPVEPQAGRTRVARKRAASGAKPAPAAVEGPRPVDDAPMGPPLPGEEGSEEASATPGGVAEPESGGTPEPEGEGESLGAAAPPSPEATDTPDGDASPPVPSGGRKRSAAQHRMILATLGGLGVDVGDREERLHITGLLIGRELDSSNNLLHHEATGLIDKLSGLKDRKDLDAYLDALGKDTPEAIEQEALALEEQSE